MVHSLKMECLHGKKLQGPFEATQKGSNETFVLLHDCVDKLLCFFCFDGCVFR